MFTYMQLTLTKKIAFSLILLLVVFFALEGGLRGYVYIMRTFFPQNTKSAFAIPHREKHSILGWRPIPDYREYDENGVLTYAVNSLGFRGPEFSQEKPRDTYRIIAVG